VEAISDLPMLHDIDADYSPQYVKLARIIRDKIESGAYERMDAVPAAVLADGYGVSMQVAYAALAMLSPNRYVCRMRGLKSYRVTWDARHGDPAGVTAHAKLSVGPSTRDCPPVRAPTARL
jgi:hypothetical protein